MCPPYFLGGGVEIKIIATRCQILNLKFTKFDSAPDPAGEAYSASPDS